MTFAISHDIWSAHEAVQNMADNTCVCNEPSGTSLRVDSEASFKKRLGPMTVCVSRHCVTPQFTYCALSLESGLAGQMMSDYNPSMVVPRSWKKPSSQYTGSFWTIC